jgi:methyl-accepting chemotaxis protein
VRLRELVRRVSGFEAAAMPSFITSLSIAKRLGVGFALVLIMSLISILVGLPRLSAVAQATQDMIDNPVKTERIASDWHRNIYTGASPHRSGARQPPSAEHPAQR